MFSFTLLSLYSVDMICGTNSIGGPVGPEQVCTLRRKVLAIPRLSRSYPVYYTE
jgi:hypothetical protein